ncbi:glyoxalase [Burkholderia lata]|uniref:Glyoxalase n=1 Tax=Burkholderia lata (strain ATCC 17760 / DSM 23089 / LMG 22485 / NCIMB 9086 / R18194 / 383) TaxID=482957 RepID=A0A6P2PXG8_BURL3|nr:glyoxalase [Burkholderia lata]VWC19147.1 glyoxalase [Burkholderia lata]VWD09188.1 glyoxalase [Burkholderia lata]
MIDRLLSRVIHNNSGRAFYDSTLGALRYKRLAWWL